MNKGGFDSLSIGFRGSRLHNVLNRSAFFRLPCLTGSSVNTAQIKEELAAKTSEKSC